METTHSSWLAAANHRWGYSTMPSGVLSCERLVFSRSIEWTIYKSDWSSSNDQFGHVLLDQWTCRSRWGPDAVASGWKMRCAKQYAVAAWRRRHDSHRPDRSPSN